MAREEFPTPAAEEYTASPTAQVLRKSRPGESWSHAALQEAYLAGGNAGDDAPGAMTGNGAPGQPPAAVSEGPPLEARG